MGHSAQALGEFVQEKFLCKPEEVVLHWRAAWPRIDSLLPPHKHLNYCITAWRQHSEADFCPIVKCHLWQWILRLYDEEFVRLKFRLGNITKCQTSWKAKRVCENQSQEQPKAVEIPVENVRLVPCFLLTVSFWKRTISVIGLGSYWARNWEKWKPRETAEISSHSHLDCG